MMPCNAIGRFCKESGDVLMGQETNFKLARARSSQHAGPWPDTQCLENSECKAASAHCGLAQAAGLAGYTLYGNGAPDRLNNVERVRCRPQHERLVELSRQNFLLHSLSHAGAAMNDRSSGR